MRQTSVCSKTVTPIYNKNFTFDKLPNKAVLLNKVNLVLTVNFFLIILINFFINFNIN